MLPSSKRVKTFLPLKAETEALRGAQTNANPIELMIRGKSGETNTRAGQARKDRHHTGFGYDACALAAQEKKKRKRGSPDSSCFFHLDSFLCL